MCNGSITLVRKNATLPSSSCYLHNSYEIVNGGSCRLKASPSTGAMASTTPAPATKLCYCNTCIDGSWQSYGWTTTDQATCTSSASRCRGTNAVTTWGNTDSTNRCSSGSNGNGGSVTPTQTPTKVPTVTPTVTPTATPAAPSNPQTGTTGIIVAWVIGLSAIMYAVWYFKKSSSVN